MSDYIAVLYSLVAVNIIAYGILSFVFLRPKLIRIPKILELNHAFGLLENSLVRSFPDLPKGFTWAEGITKAKKLNLSINWMRVDKLLGQYEAHRYGRATIQGVDPSEIVKLAYSLPKRPKKF